MRDIIERIIAARDVVRARSHDFYSREVLDAMADAANALKERDAVIADLLSHSVSHYGNVEDTSHGIGQSQARAQAILAKAGRR